MHLVHVDHSGTAFLKLRPRFQMRPDQRVVRIDASPVYDAPPSIETLLQDAARNHEIEAAYHAQGVAYQSARQDVTQSWRTQVAESFLRDTTQRALVHPSTTVRRRVIATCTEGNGPHRLRHVLFSSCDAWGSTPGHSGTRGARALHDHAALHALESGRARTRDRPPRIKNIEKFGDIVETVERPIGNSFSVTT